MGRPHRLHPLRPRSRANRLAHDSLMATLRFGLRTVWRARRSDVPPLAEGPLILAPNHRSFVDPVVLAALVDLPVTFMMSSKYYDLTLMGWFFRMQRCIVVEEDGGNRRSLQLALEVLEAGRPLVIFPEGRISPDGELQEGQPGLGFLARRSGAPVIPMWLGGTREVLPRGSWMLRSHAVVARAGRPLHIDDYGPGKQGNEHLVSDVMEAIARLGDEVAAAPPR